MLSTQCTHAVYAMRICCLCSAHMLSTQCTYSTQCTHKLLADPIIREPMFVSMGRQSAVGVDDDNVHNKQTGRVGENHVHLVPIRVVQ
jgi:hypothetical protein